MAQEENTTVANAGPTTCQKERKNQRGPWLSLPTAHSEGQDTLPSDCGRHAFDRVHVLLSIFYLFTQTRWHKRKEGTPSLQRHAMSKLYQHVKGNWQANTTQKGSPVTFLLLHFSHHIPLLHCHSPSTVRERLWFHSLYFSSIKSITHTAENTRRQRRRPANKASRAGGTHQHVGLVSGHPTSCQSGRGVKKHASIVSTPCVLVQAQSLDMCISQLWSNTDVLHVERKVCVIVIAPSLFRCVRSILTKVDRGSSLRGTPQRLFILWSLCQTHTFYR